ncbi:MAG: ankyrin repeat domain-containing protein [Alphaproteobacteria bacterium]
MGLFHNKITFLKAARTGDLDEIHRCIAYRIPEKFDINVENEDGLTALFIAVQEGNSHVALALIRAGAKVDTHNADYVYPLHNAAFNGDLDVVKALVEAKADIDAVIRTNNRTALHWAVDKEMAGVIEFLVKSGARTDIADKSGRTPIELAKGKSHLLKLFKGAEPVPAPAAAADAGERWALIGKNRIAHHGSYPDIGRKITEIFNFESRERTVISENLKTGAETLSPPESFDNLSEDALRKALAEFRAAGGAVSDEFVAGKKADKKSFRL